MESCNLRAGASHKNGRHRLCYPYPNVVKHISVQQAVSGTIRHEKQISGSLTMDATTKYSDMAYNCYDNMTYLVKNGSAHCTG